MKLVQVMPVLMAFGSMLALAVCLYAKDWKHALYWLGSSLICLAVSVL